MNEKLEKSAKNYDLIAGELEVARQHYFTAAKHFRDGEVPRGAAHAYAGWGHMNKAKALLITESIVFSDNSKP